jgi:hypothetical protein
MTTEDLVTMCCNCKKIKIGNLWIDEEHPSYELLSKRPNLKKDYCSECTEKFRKEYRELKHQYGLLRN